MCVGDVVMEVNGEQATYPNGRARTTVAALLARAAARADTRIRLRLRRPQELQGPHGGGGGSESAATLLAAAARQHVNRPQQAPRDCRVQVRVPRRCARYEQQAPRDCAMCGELGRHGETGLCAACRGAAAICTECYDQKRDFCVCEV
jgi:hypothetical protein